jgi:hypothetical protein
VKVSTLVFEIKPKAPKPVNVATPDEGVLDAVPVSVEPPVMATETAVE